MTIGLLFRWFGPTIKAYIDKYFGLITAAALVLIVSGYVAVSVLGGGAKETSEKCASATQAPAKLS